MRNLAPPVGILSLLSDASSVLLSVFLSHVPTYACLVTSAIAPWRLAVAREGFVAREGETKQAVLYCRFYECRFEQANWKMRDLCSRDVLLDASVIKFVRVWERCHQWMESWVLLIILCG